MTQKNPPLKIDRLALDGDGVGRLADGQAAFVPYTLPGEVITARPLFRKKNHSRWLPESLVSPSADRVKPECRYHFQVGKDAPACGGCDWQHMNVASQRTSKRQLVIETLTRLGGIENPPVAETISSPETWRYRNKVQVPFSQRGKHVVAGFFAPGSHDIVEFDDCLIQPSFSVDILRYVKEQANQLRWPAYEEDAHTGWIRHLLIRTNQKGEALVVFVTRTSRFYGKESFVNNLRKRFPSIIGIHQNVQPARTNVILGNTWIPLWGRDHIEESLLGLNIQYAAGSFFQVNFGAAERLYSQAIQELGISSSSLVLDLYCGVGAMALLAAKTARQAFGVEPVRSAIFDARENAKRNHLRNVEFIESDSERFLNRPSRILEMLQDQKSLVIVDPPRSGCTPDVVQGLLRLKPERMVYVSCHPATLARDLKMMSASYVVASVTPVDLFPQTSHIETVVRLEKK